MVHLSFLRKRRWTDEEQAWIDAESFPPVLIRSYTKEKHLKRDAKRLSSLGYGLSYQTWDWSGTGRWHATFKQVRR
jgi:hypothetical protein